MWRRARRLRRCWSGPLGLPRRVALRTTGANESLLVSIPKASVGAETALIEGEAGSVRPLALQTMGTKILSRAAARPVQAALCEWSSARQRGFVPRRLMLENFVELGTEAKLLACESFGDPTRQLSAIFFADFADAFINLSFD